MRIPNLDRILALDEYRALSEIHAFLTHAWIENPELTGWTPGQKQVLAVENMQMEINNGGYHQYFWNSYGDHVKECLDGLARIGAQQEIDLLKRAIALFPNGVVPEDRALRQNALDEIGEKGEDALNELADEYYALDTIDVSAALVDLIKKNRHEF